MTDPYRVTALKRHPHGGWFRIRGWGLRVIDHRAVPPFFSERQGYGGPYLHLGSFCVAPLKPFPRRTVRRHSKNPQARMTPV